MPAQTDQNTYLARPPVPPGPNQNGAAAEGVTAPRPDVGPSGAASGMSPTPIAPGYPRGYGMTPPPWARTPGVGWGFPVMGQAFYGGAGTRQPPGSPYGGRFPAAGFPGATNYPTPGNTYPLEGQGWRPGYGNPWASYGQPFQPTQRYPFRGGGGLQGAFMLNSPNTEQAYQALQARSY